MFIRIREIIIKFMKDINQDDGQQNYQTITKFIQAIKQQKLNPTLLPFQRELFEELRQMISDQREKLKDFLKYEDEQQIKVSNKNFKYMIYNSEIEKMDYLLKSYLKMRLSKIQLFSFHLIKSEHETEKILSAAEMKYLRRYSELRYQYYKDNVFKHLVKNYRDLKGIQIIFAKSQEEQRQRKAFIDTKQSHVQLKSPNLNEFVFAEILTNPKQLRFGLDLHAFNTNTEQMEVVSPGSIIYGPYRNIYDRLDLNQYRLI